MNKTKDNKHLKMIDFINLIAKEEKLPLKIKYDNAVYTLTVNGHYCYEQTNPFSYYFYLFDRVIFSEYYLNLSSIEILEEYGYIDKKRYGI